MFRRITRLVSFPRPRPLPLPFPFPLPLDFCQYGVTAMSRGFVSLSSVSTCLFRLDVVDNQSFNLSVAAKQAPSWSSEGMLLLT